MKHVTEADIEQLKRVVQQTLGMPDESKRLGCVVIVIGESDDGASSSTRMFAMGLSARGTVEAIGQAFFQACDGSDIRGTIIPIKVD